MLKKERIIEKISYERRALWVGRWKDSLLG